MHTRGGRDRAFRTRLRVAPHHHSRFDPSLLALDQPGRDRPKARRRRRTNGGRGPMASPRPQPGQVLDLTSIFLAERWTSGGFGRVTVNTPFLNPASTLASSTPNGSRIEREYDP